MGDVHTFPPRLRTVDPAPNAKTYWMSGGDLFRNIGGKGAHMTPAEARRRRYGHQEDVIREKGLGHHALALIAANLWQELTRAMDDLDTHNRVVGKPSPFEPDEAFARFSLASMGLEPEPNPPTAA